MLESYTQAGKVVRDNWGLMRRMVACNTKPDEPDGGAIPFSTRPDKPAVRAT